MLNHAKDLFQLQNELVDAKINLAVDRKISRVIDQLNDLKSQMNKDMEDLRN